MLGAYFQCYKEPRATYESLKSFRASYPSATVVLLSDNGFDYTEIAKEFGCMYIHSNDNLPVSSSTSRPEDYVRNMTRLANALTYIPEPFVMLLEDDVRVLRPYTEPFIGTINGNTINPLKDVFGLIPWNVFNGGPIRYTGHGGSVFNRTKLLDAVSRVNEIRWLATNWSTTLKLCPHRIDVDIFLSILVLSLGGSIHHLSQHKDMITNNIGRDGIETVSVLHQFKEFYGKPL